MHLIFLFLFNRISELHYQSECSRNVLIINHLRLFTKEVQ